MSYLQISTAKALICYKHKDLQLGTLQFETSVLADIVLSHSFTASYLSRNNKELHPRDPVSFEKPSGSPSSAWTRGRNDSENSWMRSLIIKLFDSGGEAGGKEGKLCVW